MLDINRSSRRMRAIHCFNVDEFQKNKQPKQQQTTNNTQ